MVTSHPPRDLAERASAGTDLYARRVRPLLRPEDDGKFVAIDVITGDYEVDADDGTAEARLRSRRPTADIWLERAGDQAAYRIGRRT